MNRTTKIFIVATSLMLLGAIIFCGAMTMNSWNFMKLSTNEYETNNYEINEDFKSISINTKVSNIKFAPSEDSKCSVVCFEEKNMKHSVTVNDGTLLIELKDERKWYERIGIGFEFPMVTVFLPKGEYNDLLVETATGDVEIAKDFKFNSMDISMTTGDIKNYASVTNALKVTTTTGKINLEKISAGSIDLSLSTGNVTASDITVEGNIKTSQTTGKLNLTNVSCMDIISNATTGDISLHNVIAMGNFRINRETGDVNLEQSDASEIYIRTETGDVKGSLLSDKVFIVNTETGRKVLPNTITGGRCEIKTETGDIKITIAK